MFGMLPPYATDMDYDRCEEIVKGMLDCEEGANVQELTLKVMNISYAKGGGYSSDTITAFAKTCIRELSAQR